MLVVGLALVHVPRCKHLDKSAVGDEVLGAPGLGLEARERAVGEVDVLPAERVETALALAGEGGDSVEYAPAKRHDRLAVRVRTAQKREQLRRVQEAKELLGVALGANVAYGAIAGATAGESGVKPKPR